MSIVVWTAVAVILALGTVVAHEAAHVRALRELGGDIEAAGAGLPFFPCWRIGPSARRSWTFTISPWLIGAYVAPDCRSRAKLDAASYRDQAWFAGAGVVANLALGAGLIAAALVLAGHPMPAIGVLGAGIGTWLARRWVATYAVPVVGFAFLGTLVYSWLTVSVRGQGGWGAVSDLLIITTPVAALGAAGVVSVGLGVGNCLPLFPADGGRTVAAALKARWGPRITERYEVASSVLLVMCVAYSLLRTSVATVLA